MSVSSAKRIVERVGALVTATAFALLLLVPAKVSAQGSPSASSPMPGAVLSSSADSAKVLVTYAGINAQAEITSPSGIHVYIDVNKPDAVASKPGPNDLLCYTHNHYDHRNMRFQKAFPGRVIDQAAGAAVACDVRVLCIPGAHMDGDKIGPGASSDYFYLIETGGLRILHTGDNGQQAYTEDQIKAFGGRIDLLFQQFDNPYSNMSWDNGLGFKLLAQLGPRLIIPTHVSPQAIRMLIDEHPALFDEKATIELSASALPAKTTLLLTGKRATDAWKANLEKGGEK